MSGGFAGTDASGGALTSLTLTTFPTNATSITINGTKYTGAAAFNAASVAARTLTTNDDGTLATGQTVTVDPVDGGVTSVLPFTVTDVQGATSAAANLNITFTATSSGYVFEDVNYGGGAGRPFSTAGTSPRSGATVELYNSITGAFVARTTTDATGKYSFNTTANTGYTVRVVNSTVTSSRTGYVAGLLPVQTYNGTTSRVGGENPARTDAPANTAGALLSTLTLPTGTTTPESIASFNTANNNGPDFGYNFDTVVNTNDAGQGSLRQFITNSNALGGEANLAQSGFTTAATVAAATTPLPANVETSIFMIPDGAAHPGLLASTNGGPASQFAATTGTSKAATILLTSAALPAITGQFTAIDGGTQTSATGNSNAYSLATPNAETTGPEVIINSNNLGGITISASNDQLLSLGVSNANTDQQSGIIVTSGATATLIQNNTVNNNRANITFSTTNPATASAATITGNVIRNSQQANADGIELNGGNNNMTISYNQILRNAGNGIDFVSTGGANTGNTITYNNFSGNGTAGGGQSQLSGVAIRAANSNNNIISFNTFNSNSGPGIVAVTGTVNNTFSQNTFSGNGVNTDGTGATYTAPDGRGLAIDLAANTSANGDGVTVNATGTRTGANNLVNFPVLTTATLSGTSLVLSGYARPGALVELFLAAPDPTGFGEGATYLTSFTQGTAVGTTGNVATGTAGAYGPSTNGLNQGSDNTNTFTATIPLSSLTPAQATALQGGLAVLTSTATISGSGTSEFSGNLLLRADVTTALTGPATVVAGQPTGTYTATFVNEGPITASTVTRKVTLPTGATNVQLPTGATLSGSTIDFGNAATLASGASSSFTFSFTPATTATGTLNIVSNVTTATTQGSDVAPNSSTITATVAPTADVYTTITANTNPVAAGTSAAATGAAKFTVTFGNNGPTTAAGVVSTVQLPTGLTNVTATGTNGGNGTYSSSTGLVTYSGIGSIASGAPITSVITFDAPVNGPVAATANIATTTSEAGLTANNAFSASIPIAPAFDLTTTLSGPVSAAPGSLVTLAVTTTNNLTASSPSAAPNVVQTVSLPQGLLNVYVSNGGVYNPDATAKNITVNGVTYANVQPGQVVFPTLASLPSGQTVANSISFSQPGATYQPSSKVSTTTTGDTNSANDTAYLNGATTSTNLTLATPLAGTANVYTTISASVPSTTVGGSVTLTVVTGNNGPNAATDVTQKVQLLPGLTNPTISNGGTYNSTTGIVTFSTLASTANGSVSGTSVSNTITFPAPASTGNNGQLLAMATVSTTNTDPVPADNVASVGITLLQSADLTTTVTGPATAQAGQPVTYLARFLNNGPMTAVGVSETVQLPAGLGTNGVTVKDATGTVISSTNYTYNSTTGLLTLPAVATDLSGATQTYNLTFAAPSQNLTVRGSVGSATFDADLTYNSSTVTTTVAASADLAATVTGPATAVVGSAVTYAVTTTNNGPSTATAAATNLKLAAGFTAATLQVGGQTGTTTGTGLSFANGAAYNNTTGLVTFASVASQAVGATTTNYVTFVMPNATGGQTTGVASVSAATTDPTPGNNTASVATSIAPPTTTLADITATVTTTAPATGVAPGTSIAFTATYGNNGPDPAANVVPTLQLAPGLIVATITVASQAGTLSNGLISFPNGAVYSQQTGLVTFVPIASQASGAANNVSYVVNVTAPADGTVTAVAATTSNTSEPNTAAAQANDVDSKSVPITASSDATTSLSGPVSAPAGSAVSYTVTTTNNGPSLTASATTQTITLPAGVTATNISNSGTQTGTTITWTIPAGQAAGVNGAVANIFTITQPTGGASLKADVALTNDSNTGNNTAYLNGATVATATTVTNLAPLAFAVVNTLQGPQSNDAGGLATGLLISPLNASDPENSFSNTQTTKKYTIVAAPDASQGTLYYNSTSTTYVAVASGQTLTDAQAQTLHFKAAATYVGNASFTYLTTDAAGNVSPTVNYTIPVETDVDNVYTVLTPKTTAYVATDVIAYTADVNGAVNNASSASVYQTNGTLQAGASNGLTNAVAVAGSFTSTNGAITSLSDLGITLETATGRLVVTAPGTLASPNLRPGNYSVSITTTDANGGLTTQKVSFTIPANPLPVVLTAFTAQAVQNRDALLNWATASEQNSASFEVERSLDGSTFAKIGQVAAQGTSLTTHAYTFTDAGVSTRAQGSVYYRLRQVDLNGTATYSPVRTVSFTKAAVVALSIYPNPATTSTSLDLSALPASASYQVLVLDATGRQVLTTTQAGGLPQPLDLMSLASGTYQVLVTGTLADGSALRQVLRLIKE